MLVPVMRTDRPQIGMGIPSVGHSMGICAKCQTKPVEPDGFCFHYGPYDPASSGSGPWLCDDCVFEERMRSAGQGVPALKPAMTQDQIRGAIETIETSIRNLTVFEGFKARDPSGACRDIDSLSLTPREARPVLEALLTVLRGKLTVQG
jgi:hypothetical protein